MKELELIVVLKNRHMLNNIPDGGSIKSGKNSFEAKVDVKDLMTPGFTRMGT